MVNKLSINTDIKKAETLPSEFYRSEELFQKSKESIFLRSWQWIGNLVNMVPLTGSAHPAILMEKFLDEPIAIVRDKEDTLHCLSNVCTHRGNIVVQSPGKLRQITCMYHGRRFHLDGTFHSMPEFNEADNFPRPCDNLTKFSIKNWKNHLFVSPDPSFDFEKIQSVMEERIGFLPIENFKFDKTLSRDYIVNAHWALYCDNYLEGFHIPFVHDNLNAQLDYGSYRTELYEYVNLQIGYSSGGEEVFELPAGHPDHGKEVSAYYYWVFPNMMFNFYPWGLSVNIVKPISIDKTKVSFLIYVHDQSKLNNGAGALLDKVEREDEFIVEGVQKGINSRFYKSGRFSPTREQGVHHLHSLLARYL
jgi:choline monooxygenase